MFEAIRKLFATPTREMPKNPPDTNLALAALLVHLAAIDGFISEKEQQTITNILREQFDLEDNEVKILFEEAKKKQQDAVDYYQFTSVLMNLSEKERVNIIRLMWQVVFADGYNHELEDNMVWRIAELIGVSSRERAILRKEIKEQSE